MPGLLKRAMNIFKSDEEEEKKKKKPKAKANSAKKVVGRDGKLRAPAGPDTDMELVDILKKGKR